jgi:hypothetical protein
LVHLASARAIVDDPLSADADLATFAADDDRVPR